MKRRDFTCLPESIIVDILSWLPFKSIFVYRCVSKYWYNLLSQSYFAKLHASRSPIQFLQKYEYNHFIWAQLDEDSFIYNAQSAAFDVPRNSLICFNLRKILPDLWTSICSSCILSGFIVLQEGRYELGMTYASTPFHVYNPITLQHIVVHQTDKHVLGVNDRRPEERSCVLVFSEKTSQLKLLRFSRLGQSDIQTIGTNCWRNICETPMNLDLSWFSPYAGGFYHFTSCRDGSIYGLDAEKEVFQLVPNPFCDEKKFERISRIGSIDNCLCLVLRNSVLEFWMMNEYGVKESWTKKFVIDDNYLNTHYSYLFLKPFRCVKNGEILFLHTDGDVIGYNPHLRKHRWIHFDGIDKNRRWPYVPSFMRILPA